MAASRLRDVDNPLVGFESFSGLERVRFGMKDSKALKRRVGYKPMCRGHRGSDGGAGDAAPGGGVAKPAAGRRRGDRDDGAGRAARPKTPGGGVPDPPLGAT